MNGNTVPVNYTGNTHGGMAEINGQWYIFYHRQTNKQKCCRQGCAEKLTILPDGKIEQSEITSCGLNPTPRAGSGTYEARIACHLTSAFGTFAYEEGKRKDKKRLHPYFTQSGSDRDECGDQYIANMKDGSTAGFKYFDFQNPTNITISVRGSDHGFVEVRTDLDEMPVARISVDPCKMICNFSGICTKHLTGTSALYFTYRGAGAIDFHAFTLN